MITLSHFLKLLVKLLIYTIDILKNHLKFLAVHLVLLCERTADIS
jgi:hypothetical protein